MVCIGGVCWRCAGVGAVSCAVTRAVGRRKPSFPTQIIEPSVARLWFAGKELLSDKKLQDYIGKNEKTKVSIMLIILLNDFILI